MLIGSERLEVYRRSPTTARIADSLDKGVGRTRQNRKQCDKERNRKEKYHGNELVDSDWSGCAPPLSKDSE